MTYKRQLWTSGYEYRVRCPYCGTFISYNDRQLGYRSWFPNGFVYCPGCRHPIRHNEFFAVNPDGSPVFRTQEEANQSVYDGYNRALGINPVRPAPSPAASPAPGGTEGTAFCANCGRQYVKGYDKFCSGCGNKLE